MDTRVPPLEMKILLESNPVKSGTFSTEIGSTSEVPFGGGSGRSPDLRALLPPSLSLLLPAPPFRSRSSLLLLLLLPPFCCSSLPSIFLIRLRV